ncbi:unnamed protein product [Prunus armeniaca]|uniref:RNase H type-1 domain-containing protein n=1 Tax=Prunus armeniaca TaxID=36596 RepID=A0A6J5Y280_PRUAR|nr:unnamed protein product [Prunus armeniaca]
MAVDFCKFNVDGALNMSSGTRGGGMVVRDSVGCFYDAVALRAPSLLYVLATKLYALKFGISFAIDASFFPLVIETNSLSATHFILKDEVCYAAEKGSGGGHPSPLGFSVVMFCSLCSLDC